LQVLQAKDTYISHQLEGKHISVGKQYAGHKIALAFTGITTDLELIITRKQAMPSAVTESLCEVPTEETNFCYGRIILALPSYTSRVNSRGFNGQ
jgi:hypothetical protein